jgi:hypothetical protein
VPARDRRTIGELLADSDALARETLLDATPENAPAMVRSWNQLVASAVHLWAALASRPDSMSGSDPMERLRVVGQAIGRDLLQRLAPTLEANQVAWSRLAKRWGELTSPASRIDPALVAAASEVRAAIAATATTQNGWAAPNQLASRVDLVKAVKTFHLSMIASVDIAHVARDTAADHPGLTATARIIGMRAQGEAEIAIEQGETRYEGIRWTTPRQISANEVIPLPEPARRGLINLTDDVIATANQSVAAAAQLDPSDVTRSVRSGPEAGRGRLVERRQVTHPPGPLPKGPRR